MSTGYIEYNNKVVQIEILKNYGNDLIVKTEENEILEIPPESYTFIWPNKELALKYLQTRPRCCWIDGAFMSEERVEYENKKAFVELSMNQSC